MSVISYQKIACVSVCGNKKPKWIVPELANVNPFDSVPFL